MRENEFREWMIQLGTMQPRPIGDTISRCKRVIKALGVNLDTEYLKDHCQSLVQQLEYTTEDARNGVLVDDAFNFSANANIKNGMASLRSAINKYVEFCMAEKP